MKLFEKKFFRQKIRKTVFLLMLMAITAICFGQGTHKKGVRVGITTLIDSIIEIDYEILRFYTSSRYFDVYTPFVADTTNWYFSMTGGDDDNDGHSVQTPKQTFPHLLTLDLEAGDSVFFNKGDTWRLTADGDMTWIGAEGNHITFTSYGSGDLPRILGSDTTTAWTNEGSNVWSSVSTFPTFTPTANWGRVWFVEIDDSIKWGKYESGGTGDVDEPYDFYYNAVTDIVYIYSTSDPALEGSFTSIEVPIIGCVFELKTDPDSAEYYTFDGLEVAYAHDILIRNDWPGGISPTSDRVLRGFEVRNCLIHHVGAKDGEGHGINSSMSDVVFENNEIHNCGRRGISIGCDASIYTDTIENILIQDNYFHDGWHTTGPDIIQGGAGADISNITIRRNIIEDNPELPVAGGMGSMGMFIAEQGTQKIYNVYIYNNLIKYAKGGGAIQTEYIDSLYIYNNTIYGANENGTFNLISLGYVSDTADIRNNIIYSDVSTVYCLAAPDDGNGYNIEYNLYYTDYPSSYSFLYAGGDSYRQVDWASWKSTENYDANSPTPTDPLFVDAPDDLRVYSTSDAVGAGVDIAGYTTDYAGVTVSSPPNIGAYETSVVAYLMPQYFKDRWLVYLMKKNIEYRR